MTTTTVKAEVELVAASLRGLATTQEILDWTQAEWVDVLQANIATLQSALRTFPDAVTNNKVLDFKLSISATNYLIDLLGNELQAIEEETRDHRMNCTVCQVALEKHPCPEHGRLSMDFDAAASAYKELKGEKWEG